VAHHRNIARVASEIVQQRRQVSSHRGLHILTLQLTAP
jgi:hypothetical protein